MNTNNDDIDVIIYWVNGADPVWQAKKNAYAALGASDAKVCRESAGAADAKACRESAGAAAPEACGEAAFGAADGKGCECADANEKSDASLNRYRDWEILVYWFRGIELYMPWVRKVFFVSDEQIPEWLNLDNEKLVYVDHKDFIPKEYLPTFSANPIELNFHRIKGLSEQFIVFNDDFFVNGPVKPTDFFRNGLPVDICMEYPAMCGGNNPIFANILINGFNLIGSYFGRSEYKKRLRNKILSPKYGAYFFYNLIIYMFPFPRFFGLLTPHFARPYLKSSYVTLWDKEYEKLNATCKNKFRDRDDVNSYIFRNYNILSGNFVPGNIFKMGKAYFITNDATEAARDIRNRKHKLICLNDDCDDAYFEEAKSLLKDAFESVMPSKSSFEI